MFKGINLSAPIPNLIGTRSMIRRATMLLEALYHVPRDKWAYAYDKETVHLRLRTKRDDAEAVYVMTGDKYAWDRTFEEIQMKKRLQTTVSIIGKSARGRSSNGYPISFGSNQTVKRFICRKKA